MSPGPMFYTDHQVAQVLSGVVVPLVLSAAVLMVVAYLVASGFAGLLAVFFFNRSRRFRRLRRWWSRW